MYRPLLTFLYASSIQGTITYRTVVLCTFFAHWSESVAFAPQDINLRSKRLESAFPLIASLCKCAQLLHNGNTPHCYRASHVINDYCFAFRNEMNK